MICLRGFDETESGFSFRHTRLLCGYLPRDGRLVRRSQLLIYTIETVHDVYMFDVDL